MQASRCATHSAGVRHETPLKLAPAIEAPKLSSLGLAGHSPLQFASAFSITLTFSLPNILRRQAEQGWSFQSYR